MLPQRIFRKERMMNKDGSVPAEPKGVLNSFYGGRNEKRKANNLKRVAKKTLNSNNSAFQWARLVTTRIASSKEAKRLSKGRKSVASEEESCSATTNDDERTNQFKSAVCSDVESDDISTTRNDGEWCSTTTSDDKSIIKVL
jgi:hypothetical protein